LKADQLPLVVAPTEPLPGRACGTCTLCCKVLGVQALDKPRGTWCTHCEKGVGCRVYETRPDACRTFLCGWLINPRFGAEWKPERSKIVIAVAPDGNGLVFHCDPGFPQAWRKEPYHGEILRLASQAVPNDGTILVCVGRKMTIVTPEREFPVGEVGDDEEIIREYSGKRLVGARVVKTGRHAD
jgi:hypothetical protein